MPVKKFIKAALRSVETFFSKRQEVVLSDKVMNIRYTLSKKADQASPQMESILWLVFYNTCVNTMGTINPCVIRSRIFRWQDNLGPLIYIDADFWTFCRCAENSVPRGCGPLEWAAISEFPGLWFLRIMQKYVGIRELKTYTIWKITICVTNQSWE